MQLVHDISKYITIFFIMILIMIAIVGAIAYYLLKIKKVASQEELFDYSRFERKDSVDYVRFEQIINSVENHVQTTNGIIVADAGMRFIAGLKVNGYNFFSASAEEQHQSMSGMISFLNTVEGDVQYRQSTKAIDLSVNIEAHKKRLKEVIGEIYGMQMDHSDLVERAEQFLNDPETYLNYEKKIIELEKAMTCKSHTQQELEMVIRYMETISSNNYESERVQCWFYDWVYNPNDYTEELSVSEQYDKAAEALTTKANAYISSLQRTGCTCERLIGDELLELFRYHFAPITADTYKIPDLYNSSYNSLYVSSDSLSLLENESIEEKNFREQMRVQMEAEIQAERERMAAMPAPKPEMTEQEASEVIKFEENDYITDSYLSEQTTLSEEDALEIADDIDTYDDSEGNASSGFTFAVAQEESDEDALLFDDMPEDEVPPLPKEMNQKPASEVIDNDTIQFSIFENDFMTFNN